jgi:hypothetical protein
MSEFLFLYRNEESTDRMSPEEGQAVMQKWMAWMKKLGEQGHLKNVGQPLEYGGKVVQANKTITDGPYAEAKDLVSGYTLISADSLDEAAELAKGCPIFERGGLVEVRPVMLMDM